MKLVLVPVCWLGGAVVLALCANWVLWDYWGIRPPSVASEAVSGCAKDWHVVSFSGATADLSVEPADSTREMIQRVRSARDCDGDCAEGELLGRLPTDAFHVDGPSEEALLFLQSQPMPPCVTGLLVSCGEDFRILTCTSGALKTDNDRYRYVERLLEVRRENWVIVRDASRYFEISGFEALQFSTLFCVIATILAPLAAFAALFARKRSRLGR